jgi:anaerobic selenocysteine-containing dehydrogenase
MTHGITRRDLLKLAGGTALGLVFSPLPWKLLDDTSIWTQNWDRIPKLSQGALATLTSSCPLCPTGCAVSIRTAGGIPSSMSGASSDPVSLGTLCPSGLTGHHLRYHPLRLMRPLEFDGRFPDSSASSIGLEEAFARIGKLLSQLRTGSIHGSLVIIGTSPLSAAAAALIQGCEFVAPPSHDDRSLGLLRRLAVADPGPLAFAPARANVILSFGAPVLDGWHGYAIPRLRRQSGTGTPRVIQVETFPSRTALAADRWLQVRPGTEGLLALGIARILVEEHPPKLNSMMRIADLAAFTASLREHSLDEIAAITGIGVEVIKATATEFTSAPSFAIAGCDPGGGPLPHHSENLIAALNVLVGNPSPEGAIVPAGNLPGS